MLEVSKVPLSPSLFQFIDNKMRKEFYIGKCRILSENIHLHIHPDIGFKKIRNIGLKIKSLSFIRVSLPVKIDGSKPLNIFLKFTFKVPFKVNLSVLSFPKPMTPSKLLVFFFSKKINARGIFGE
jgi:hypothetical protein